jgi:S-adenosylmethionine uptake transporter
VLINELANSKRKISAPLLMVAATLLFATMSMCVKFASESYSTGEIVFYRGIVGTLMMLLLARVHGGTLRTSLPAMHFWRSLTGVSSLGLWFYAIGKLPLSTAVTLNYMSPIWMVVLLIGGSAFRNAGNWERMDVRLVCTVLIGFVGVILHSPANHGTRSVMGRADGLTVGFARSYGISTCGCAW